MSSTFDRVKLSGARKAAILVTVLGEDNAATMIRDLNEQEMQRVADEVASLGVIPAELSIQVIEEYQRMTQAQDFLVQGGYELARRLLVKAFGEGEADDVLLRLTKSRESKPPGKLSNISTMKR